jgi:hypothetical protein
MKSSRFVASLIVAFLLFHIFILSAPSVKAQTWCYPTEIRVERTWFEGRFFAKWTLVVVSDYDAHDAVVYYNGEQMGSFAGQAVVDTANPLGQDGNTFYFGISSRWRTLQPADEWTDAGNWGVLIKC